MEKSTYINQNQFIKSCLKIKNNYSRKRELKINKDNTAIIIIDMQNYFLSKNSHAYIPASSEILPYVNQLIQNCNIKKIPIIFSRHYNSNKNTQFMNWWKRSIDYDSFDFHISKQILWPKEKIIIDKETYDCFYKTELENYLQKKNIYNIIFVGVMANLCVETTIRSSFVRGYNSILCYNGIGAFNRNLHLNTLENLGYGFTHIRSCSEILDIIKEF